MMLFMFLQCRFCVKGFRTGAALERPWVEVDVLLVFFLNGPCLERDPADITQVSTLRRVNSKMFLQMSLKNIDLL